ncbi:Polygalacturonase inhibitor 2 [Apostasia shenzhenica]|uniref:Polygalacturonase inhibitor 2 n=1 Tax=Apostasia shenzhenica TaxID=1088818 RepID=A0A2I0A6Z5_9ASPA|nr:Polygalacturonase inhibitor 2 [Apostasia shenzhenica]
MINNRSKSMATSTPTKLSNAIHLLVFLLLLPFAAAGKCNKDDKRALLAIGFNVSYNQLCGKIPAGPITAKFGPDAFFHNKCLCGSPLPPCLKS